MCCWKEMPLIQEVTGIMTQHARLGFLLTLVGLKSVRKVPVLIRSADRLWQAHGLGEGV